MKNPRDDLMALAPCPFCHGAAYLHEQEGQRPEDTRYSVHCDECAATHDVASQAEAIAAWNRRVPSRPATQVVDREALAWDHRVLCACENCTEHAPENSVFAREDIGVMPDGTWLCEYCYSDCEKTAYGMIANDIDDFECPRFEDLPRPSPYTHPQKSPDTSAEEMREALLDATANLVGAASAYRKHAARHRSIGRAIADPFFTTRAVDLEKAAERAQAAIRQLPTSKD